MSNKDIYAERITAVRELMRKNSLDAYLIGSRDEYLNENVDKEQSLRIFISGFDGTAGDVLVTQEKAYLIVDGRYHTQADNQVDKDLFIIEKVGIDDQGNRIKELMTERFIKLLSSLAQGKNYIVGFNPEQYSVRMCDYLRNEIQKTAPSCIITPVINNLLNKRLISTDEKQIRQVYKINDNITGLSCTDKLKLVREKLSNINVQAIFVTALDELSYLTNFRGNEIEFNSTFKGYAFVTPDSAYVFTEVERFDNTSLANLNDSFEVVDIKELDIFLENFIKSINTDFIIGFDPSNTTFALLQRLNRLINRYCKLLPIEDNPIKIMKAIKNKAELKYMKECFASADKTFSEVIKWVNAEIKAGKAISENDIKEKVYDTFIKNGANRLSFETIAATGSNSAIVHYTECSKKAIIKHNQLVLIDAGAYFEGGYATDLTRTFIAGAEIATPDFEQKLIYTLVLKAAIKGLTAEIPPESDGEYLDNIVRSIIIENGYDYNHGTGHGIGILVHEAPPTISFGPNAAFKLQENMVFSIEPGIYIEGWGGVRFENIVSLKKHSNQSKAMNGWLEVKCLTFAPIDENLINYKMLDDCEKVFLEIYKNRYEEPV